MKKIGLLFGSFNPVHIGHLIIAETVADSSFVDEVWLVVSPQNPFKQKKSLLNQYNRLHLVHLATEDNAKLKPSNIEFTLPQPSYTIDTLTYLQEKYAKYAFTLIMGEDNLKHFHKWKNYEQILKQCEVVVYPRKDYKTDRYNDHPKIHRLTVPLLDISATEIRQRIKSSQSARYMVTEKVYACLQEEGWYE